MPLAMLLRTMRNGPSASFATTWLPTGRHAVARAHTGMSGSLRSGGRSTSKEFTISASEA
jgi:hypothetical protein